LRGLARRYAPLVAIVVLAGVVVALRGGSGGDDGGAGEAVGVDNVELVRSGPMTPQKAELVGTDPGDIDWGPNCDTDRGTIELPTRLAPPCVEPFPGGGDDTGEVEVVYYQSDPALDPAGAALVGATGADVDPESAARVIEDYVRLYNDVFETYGRRVVVETYTGTGAGDDPEAARADAIAIAERQPFAVIGGPGQAGPAFATEVAERRILCLATCAWSAPDELIDEYAPYLWPLGPTPGQMVAMTSEAVGRLAGPGPAVLAGDAETRRRDRVYALVRYDSPDGDYGAVFGGLADQLADHGIELETEVPFELDFARMQEAARTVVTRLKAAGVTTVIYAGDPLTPQALTAEATAQDYHPEWLLGTNILADTALFARQNDGDQWRHGFGLAFGAARGERSTRDSWRIYEWAHGEPPANNTVGTLEPPLRMLFTGIHLAGAELTPETFRDGLFRSPVAGGGPTVPQTSWGDHGVWPGVDRGGVDDAALIWWDPDAAGEDETGAPGRGLYRYARGGRRYTVGDFPTSLEDAGLFDDRSSVTVYDEIPEDDRVPNYRPPDG
jgi:hypothetical protein